MKQNVMYTTLIAKKKITYILQMWMLIKQVIGSELSLTDQFPNSTDWLNQFLKNAELSLFLSPSINLERFAHFHHYIGIVQPVWQLLRQV